jgi:hypothetical protein
MTARSVAVLPLDAVHRNDTGAAMAMRLRLDRRDDEDVFALVVESTLPEQVGNPDARATMRHSIVHLDAASALWLRDRLTWALAASPPVRSAGGATQVGSVVLATLSSGNLHIRTVHGGHVGAWENQHVVERADRDDLLVALTAHLQAERGE